MKLDDKTVDKQREIRHLGDRLSEDMSWGKTPHKSGEGIFQDENAIKTQIGRKPPKNTSSSCTVCTSEALLNTAQQLSTTA